MKPLVLFITGTALGAVTGAAFTLAGLAVGVEVSHRRRSRLESTIGMYIR